MAQTEPIRFQSTSAYDWIMSVMGLGFLLLSGFVLATSSAADWARPTGVRGEWMLLLVDKEFGVPGIRLLFTIFGLAFGCVGLGAVWRLKDHHQALTVDPNGLSFHPSFCPKALVWADVDSVTLSDGFPREIQVRLKRRFWSLALPFTSRTVALNLRAINLSYRDAADSVSQMRRWWKS